MREINLTDIGNLTGKDRKTINDRLLKANVTPLRKEGNAYLYDSRKALQAIYVKTADETKLKERELKAKAEKLEIEVEAMKGKFVDVSEVEKVVREEYTIVRQRLIGLPAKLAKPVSFIEDPSQVQELIMDNVNECLEELKYGKQLEAKIAENQAKDSEATTEA